MTTENKLVVIGGSAGSLDVLLHVLPLLKANLAAAIIIVVHRKGSVQSQLTELLASKTSLRVKEAEEKEPIEDGVIYLAPADYHLLVENDRTLSLDYSEKINYSRPSIDITFECAAEVYGASVVAVLLSGANADGVEGLKAVVRHKGTAAVQDPETADVAYMPQQALLKVPGIAHKLTPAEIAMFINSIC